MTQNREEVLTCIEKYDRAFRTTFDVGAASLDELEYQSTPGWDSVGHMGLMETLEAVFDIQMGTDDIIDFSSYKKGKEIIAKYGVAI